MLDSNQNPTGDHIEGTIGDNVDLASVGKDNTQTSNRTGDVHVHLGKEVGKREEEDPTISMRVEEELRRKIIEHELALGKLELYVDRNDMAAMDYIRKLQADMTDVREDLKELAGLEIVMNARDPSKTVPWIPIATLSILLFTGVTLLAAMLTILYFILGGRIPTLPMMLGGVVQLVLLVIQVLIGRRLWGL